MLTMSSRQEAISSDTEVRENPNPILNKLLIVRHGDYDERTNALNEVGKKQMSDLGEQIREIKDKEKLSTLIITSTAFRAVESAEILTGIINAPVEKNNLLFYYTPSPKTSATDLQAISNLIDLKGKNIDMLILVTHIELCRELPVFIGRNKLNQGWAEEPIGKGEGWVIDLKAKSKNLLMSEERALWLKKQAK
jgi:phosphohistidine phosphatase SixA